MRDFVWWSGLPAADAKRGMEMNRARHEIVEGRTYWRIGRSPAAEAGLGSVHLLPVYDEYLVAYRDREAVPHTVPTIEPRSQGTATFQHALTTPFLWYDDKAEEAMNFYVSLFKNSKVIRVTRYGDTGPGPKGGVMTAEFELNGQRFVGLNGGPHFKFTEAISFVVPCDT